MNKGTFVAAGTIVVSGLCVMTAGAPFSSPAAASRLAAGSATAKTKATTTLPTVTEIPPGTGEHGYPYDAAPQTPVIPEAPSIDLTAAGYAEEEFLMSGTTNIYQQSGLWLSNGKWNVSVAQSGVPYTTRLLVRYPTNPADFNGTVVVEWLNDTTGGDQDPVWAQVDNELVDNGFAYVGVTAQNAGMADLKTWDPARYGSLGDTGDGQSYDIFTQAAEVARADTDGLLGGLTPTEVIGTGDSQSAFRVDTYVNALQPLTHAFNGFLAVGRSAVDAPIGSGLLATGPIPSLVRTDNTAPFLEINTQGDIEELDAGLARQTANTDLRIWEVTGASHIDDHEAAYELETVYREQPNVAIPNCALGTPIEGTGTLLDGINQADDMPLYEVEDAGVAALQKWVTQGIAPPQPSSLSTTPLFGFDLVDTNQYGLAS
ncbi:MAG TPA: alpha/beta hydrolase domain-containing protein, partial [Acidimicrobiales bacterium]|nr:alpha/beta hydrolase domain-containing protein [Acidimicrobiales bacterium]